MSPTYSVCADHGYITGEQYTCPTCGKKTEVYSRITGYYRPVQNWNDGKTQEYKDRKVYDIGNSVLKPLAQKEETACVCEAPKAEVTADAKAILFSRVTCPNCRVAEGLLGKAGVAYEKLIADEHVDLCKKYGVKGAPTLVITDGENHVNYYSVPEIKKYLASL
jgi:ribonucleoside-triphosphate reductase